MHWTVGDFTVSKSDMKRRNVMKGKDAYAEGDFCHDCQLKRGAIMPDAMNCITVSLGVCDSCGEETSIVPSSDYHWPYGRKRVWD